MNPVHLTLHMPFEKLDSVASLFWAIPPYKDWVILLQIDSFSGMYLTCISWTSEYLTC